MVFRKKQVKPQLLVRDLMNDLEREDNIKKRIQEYLNKPIDRPVERGSFVRDFSNSIGVVTTAMVPSSFWGGGR